MSLTITQTELVKDVQEILTARGIAFLTGPQNGKTRIGTRVQEWTGTLTRTGRGLKKRHAEDPDIVFLEHIGFGGRKYTPSVIGRPLLKQCGQSSWGGEFEIQSRMSKVLLDAKRDGKIFCVLIDNAEILREKDFDCIKSVNEWRYNGEDVGIAFVVAGNYARMRARPDFYQRVDEIVVGKINSIADIEQFIETRHPGRLKLFPDFALKELSKCPTTLTLAKAVSTMLKERVKFGYDNVQDKLATKTMEKVLEHYWSEVA